MTRNNKFGFSLIELSIVILVIGIIVSAVVSSNSIISKANTTAAQKLSEGISTQYTGMTFWFDSTNAGSFVNTGLSDGTTLTSGIKNLADGVTLTISGGTQIYKASVLNGLPGISYTGNGGQESSVYKFNSLIGSNADFTLFVVTKGSNNAIIGQYVSGQLNDPNYALFSLGGNGTFFVYDCPTSGYTTSSNPPSGHTNVPYLTSVTAQRNTTSGLKIYYNGTLLGSNNTGSGGTECINSNFSRVSNVLVGSNPGAGQPFFVGEILIFNRVMADTERKEIEVYLSKKWGMKLS